MKNNSHESYLVPFFKEMNRKFPQKWCVLHSYETLPEYSKSDVDMAFSGDDISKLEEVIFKVAHENDWMFLQKFWYDEPYAFYYVLKKKEQDVFLAVDFMIDNLGIGVYGFKSSELTKGCLKFKGIIPIPNYETAFCYKIVKRVYKKKFVDSDKIYLAEQFRKADKRKVSSVFVSQFGERGANLLMENFNNNNFYIKATDIEILNRYKRKLFFKNLLFFKKGYWKIKRTINRFFYPPGLLLYIPKMSEKNTIKLVEGLSQKLDILFRDVYLDNKSNMVNCFKQMLKSKLVICSVDKIENRNIILFDWFKTDVRIESIETFNSLDLEAKINFYYKTIIEILGKRKKFKAY